MNARIAFIVFYFGPFPNYFPLYIRSCEHNSFIDWHIFTDNRKVEGLPDNVIHHHTTLEQCRMMFQDRFSYPICLPTARKMCDYKPFYGYLLEKELERYDFWGHCDLDQIFGKIMLREEELVAYDKLYTLGHFTLYRNRSDISRVLLGYKKGNRSREVLQSEHLVGMDEWGADNANEIFLKSGYRFLSESYGADIWPGSHVFQLSEYNRFRNRYYPVPDTKGILKYEDGVLYFIKKDRSSIEVPYVHLQKRTMKVLCDKDADTYYITPEGFLPESFGLEKALEIGLKEPVFDRQYWKIKKNNFRYRILSCLR